MIAKKIFILSAVTIVLFVLLLFLLTQRETTENGTDINSPRSDTAQSAGQNIDQTTAESLKNVNPEERNILLKHAGLPFENNQFAITYRKDKNAPFGVVLQVIDKSSNSGVSNNVKRSALDLLKSRGIEVNDIKIEYRINNE